MCLKACRRLPLNSPCVSLRLTPTTPKEVRQEAARALLSGGAHPILFNDDKMVNGESVRALKNFKQDLHKHMELKIGYRIVFSQGVIVAM